MSPPAAPGGEPCAICQRPTSDLAGDPGLWPIRLGFVDGNGATRVYCQACVMRAVAAAERPTPASEPQPKTENILVNTGDADLNAENFMAAQRAALDDTDARIAATVDFTRYKPRPGPPIVIVELEYWRELTTEVTRLRATLDAREAELAIALVYVRKAFDEDMEGDDYYGMNELLKRAASYAASSLREEPNP